MVPLTSAELVAHVQADAVSDLPTQVVAVPHPVSHGARRALQGLAPIGAADLVHGLDVDLPLQFGLGRQKRRAQPVTVITVHDLSVFDVPWASSRYRAYGERLLVTQAVKRADAIIAVSAFTAERVKARFGRDATVVHLAPDPSFLPASNDACEEVRQRLNLPERFVLQVASIEPRKDVHLLSQACGDIGVPLVLAGGVAPGCTVPNGAQYLGYVAHADLAALYGSASAVAYISNYEGFGLPPLDAMACGGAVVATRVGALGDVVGDGALLVAAGDLTALGKALRSLVEDGAERAELRARATVAAGQLTWQKTAQDTRSLYNRLGVAA